MHCPKCPPTQVAGAPEVIYTDTFHPQLVNVVHPVQIVNRHHCVPVPQHVFTYSYRDEFVPSPSYGPVAQIRNLKKKKPKK